MLQRLILLLLPFIVTACATPQVQDSEKITIEAQQQAQTSNASFDQVLQNVRDLQSQAKQENLAFFSPNYMASAEMALSQAEAAASTKDQSLAMTEALKAKAFYERGLAIKPLAQEKLSETFSGMKMLQSLGADQRLLSDYKDINENIKDVIRLIEQGKSDKLADEQKALLEEIQELEIDTLSLLFIKPVQMALEKAEDADAETYASQSFDKAEQAIERLEKLINQEPQQRQQIKTDSERSVRLAQHAQHVAQAAKPLMDLDPETAEQHILSIERFLSRIGGALGEKDVTHLPLDSQSIALAQTAEILAKQAKSKLEQQLQQNQTQNENQRLRQRIKELEALLEAAHQKPTSQDEDVSKQEQSTDVPEPNQADSFGTE